MPLSQREVIVRFLWIRLRRHVTDLGREAIGIAGQWRSRGGRAAVALFDIVEKSFATEVEELHHVEDEGDHTHGHHEDNEDGFLGGAGDKTVH